MTDNKEWLANLKAGDKVLVSLGNGWGKRIQLDEVERVTKTQVVLKSNVRRFRRDDGRQIEKPARFSTRDFIYPATGEALAEYRLLRARESLRSLKVEGLNDNQVLSMYRAMKDHES